MLQFIEIMKQISVEYATRHLIEVPTADSIVSREISIVPERKRNVLFTPTYRAYIEDFITKHGIEYYQMAKQKEPKSDVRIAECLILSRIKH